MKSMLRKWRGPEVLFLDKIGRLPLLIKEGHVIIYLKEQDIAGIAVLLDKHGYDYLSKLSQKNYYFIIIKRHPKAMREPAGQISMTA